MTLKEEFCHPGGIKLWLLCIQSFCPNGKGYQGGSRISWRDDICLLNQNVLGSPEQAGQCHWRETWLGFPPGYPATSVTRRQQMDKWIFSETKIVGNVKNIASRLHFGLFYWIIFDLNWGDHYTFSVLTRIPATGLHTLIINIALGLIFCVKPQSHQSSLKVWPTPFYSFNYQKGRNPNLAKLQWIKQNL